VSKIADFLAGAPATQLRSLVSSYGEIRYKGFPSGTHLGLPSRHLTVVFALEEPLRLAASLDRSRRTGSFTALLAGFHTTAVAIEHDGRQSAISLELTPAGARSLLGVPASDLVGTVVHLEDLLGPQSGAWTARGSGSWQVVERSASATWRTSSVTAGATSPTGSPASTA
jgi:hypothetical protein